MRFHGFHGIEEYTNMQLVNTPKSNDLNKFKKNGNGTIVERVRTSIRQL